MVLGAMVMVALAADPAQGSAVGPFLYADVDGAFTASPLSGQPAVSPSTGVVGGIGVEVAHFRLVPTASFGVFQRTPLQPNLPLNYGYAFSTAVSATDLVHERHTGLRLSPVIGFSHAATRQTQAPSTSLNAGFALERRFGPVEIAWRPRGRYYFSSYRCEGGGICVEPEWELSNAVWLEGWVLPQLSVGGGLGWTATWGDVPYFMAWTGPFPPQHALGGSASVTWTPLSFLGLAASVSYSRRLQWSQLTYSGDALAVTLAVWFRTDAKLQRNWLER